MTEAEVMERIAQILQSDFQVPRERITPQATFRGTLGLDSLDAVDLIYLIGKSFGIKPSIEEYRELQTVQSVVEHIRRKLSA
ncbi:MAG: acyl carrier protein [Myxococcales bacterium]